jgi:flagellar basal body P-ring protein FlgI
MQHPARHHRFRRLCAGAAAALATCALVPACSSEKPKQNAAVKINYADLGDKPAVPAYMKGTIYDLTDRTNDEPYLTATYGLVSHLRGTGDSTASLQVRQWMVKQMARHGFGSKLIEGYQKLGPEEILRDPNYAIVRVDGAIPPGAREADFFDVRVRCMPGNKTTSLSGGVLFESELYQLRGSAPDMTGVEVLARSRGPIVVNPAYALADPDRSSGQAKASLRDGMIMDGGQVVRDRPIILRLRHPARAMARTIEMRINSRFQKQADRLRKDVMPLTYQAAAAMDEGLVEVYVPRAYRGDWEHFMGVVQQLYVNDSPALALAKAKELTQEALKPKAPLREISWGLEAIGQPALQFTLPLMLHNSADVAFAMARASIFIGDDTGAAQEALLKMAKNDANPFQLAAIQTLGALPASPERNQRIRGVLDSRNTLARVEAYKVLVRNKDASMYSRVVKEKFVLDIVPAAGEPLIYASSTGMPRIALIGPKPELSLPAIFTAMDKRLMISTPNKRARTVMLFFRDDKRDEPLKMTSRPDVAEIVARLGGEGAPSEEKFDFSYGEIAAVLQSMSQQRKITAARVDGQVALASFLFEKPRDAQGVIEMAPVIEETRPNTAGSGEPTTAAEKSPAADAGGATHSRTGASVAQN